MKGEANGNAPVEKAPMRADSLENISLEEDQTDTQEGSQKCTLNLPSGPIKASTTGSGEGGSLPEEEAAIYRAKMAEQRRLAKERLAEQERCVVKSFLVQCFKTSIHAVNLAFFLHENQALRVFKIWSNKII